MSKSITFLEQLLDVATKEEDVEFLTNLLFQLQKNKERKTNESKH